jgi:hypothetical protein
MRVARTLRNHVGFQATCDIGCLITLTTWVASDPKLPFTTTLAEGWVGWEAVIRSSRLNDARSGES